MAKVELTSGPTILGTGILQLENAVPMDGTLRSVADQSNTTSPLKLSTGLVSVASTLQIATNDTQYLDAEDTGGNNRFTISRNAGSQVVNVDFASNPTLGTDQVGAIRTYQDGVSLSDAIGFQKNGQVTFTERVKIEADSTSTTQSAAVIQSTTTNAGLVLQPNGTGAIMAQVPDGTAAGGNARGQNAVDLQMVRTVNNQVASAIGSTISGGESNMASSNYSTVSGGQSNTASTNTHATVVGGQGNTSSGILSISGGHNNVASGQRSVALGYNNTASGSYGVALGSRSQATNLNSIAIGGWSASGGPTASGQFSVALGYRAQAVGDYSVAIGGQSYASGNNAVAFQNARAEQNHSIAFGSNTKGYFPYGFSLADGRFGQNGDAQISFFPRKTQATLASGGTTTLNGGTPDGLNRAWNVTVKWVAVITADGGAAGITVGDTIASTEQLLFKRVGGVSSVVGTASTISTHSDASMASCSMAYTAGANQELELTFTGPTFVAGGPVTCRVVAKVELTEVAW